MSIFSAQSNTFSRKPFVHFPFFLFFIPLYFYLHNVEEFFDLIFIKEVFFLLLFWMILPFLVFAAASRIPGLSRNATICITIYVVVFFFSFGALQDFLHHYIYLRIISKTFVLILIFLIAGFWAVYFFRKTKRTLTGVIKYAKLFFCILILIECLSISKKAISSGTYSTIAKKAIDPLAIRSGLSGTAPDIYYIIFDGYASSDALNDHWHYENPIDRDLLERGFFVSKNSNSNYNFTPFSIASVLNMQYLKNVDLYLPRTKKNFYIGKLLFQNDILVETLRSHDYSINVHSFLFSDDQLNSFGTFAPGNRQNWLREQTLERIYVSPWLLNSIINLFRKNKSMPESVNRSVRNCVDYNNQALQNILHKETSEKGKDRPVFSYTHFLLPHDPYLYDENGHEKKVLTDDNEMNNYLQQVKYANSIIRKIVSILLDDSARKKIIIIQGDHGFRNFSNSVPLQEQFRNFNAIYFPGQNYNIVATNSGMINTFRIILNNFFNSNLPLLKDSIVLPKHADTGETETDQKTVINN